MTMRILATSPERVGSSAYFGAFIPDFLCQSEAEILGVLTEASAFDVEIPQRDAWQSTIRILRSAVQGLRGHVFLEFDVPRLGSRIDAVIVEGGTIIPIEFKVGESKFDRDAINQAWDYALDLKYFHSASHSARIRPILVATKAGPQVIHWGPPFADDVSPPARCNGDTLGEVIQRGLAEDQAPAIDGEHWARSPYRPTPTIIQAARALYHRHSVDAISRSEAGATNLAVTSRRVEEVIDDARRTGSKAIVFVTGVPGAGKTLVGLNVATRRREVGSPTHAVFLSGNGPLVAVLKEALIRDGVARRQERGERVRKGDIAKEVEPFIQNVHHFRDDGVRDAVRPPHEHVVIFDEAQRAWDLAKTSDFMRRRKKLVGFRQSEPDFLIAYMDRHRDWAVIVCLVGGGQEIHLGEAGIGAWLEAIKSHFGHWRVFISSELRDAEYAAAEAIREMPDQMRVSQEPDLHLSVSMRSFRAERVSHFVKTVLDCEAERAQAALGDFSQSYPVVITRDLEVAKRWIRDRSRGSERCGLLASSQAARLKPHAIDIRVSVNPVHWFLNGPADTRSSNYLEDAATEFQVQGLEVDWACVNWDADLRYAGTGWSFHRFRGSRWENAKQLNSRRYMLNAYRVLLTRARQGMVIFVPKGNQDDPTRAPRFYDGTYRYLTDLGIPEA